MDPRYREKPINPRKPLLKPSSLPKLIEEEEEEINLRLPTHLVPQHYLVQLQPFISGKLL